MSDQNPNPPADKGDLQFERAEFDGATAVSHSCSVCRQPIGGTYFHVNDSTVCPTCREGLERAFTGGSSAARGGRALVFGAVAAALGAGIYFGISAATGYAFGLVAILVGFMVGWAVKRGANARGGWFYQAMAMGLTYFAIVATYIPSIAQGMRMGETEARQASASTNAAPANDRSTETTAARADQTGDTASVGAVEGIVRGLLVLVIAFAAPFLAGFENIIGLIIIAIGLYEAWKLNKRPAFHVTGPFEVSAARAGAPPAAPVV